MNMTSLKVWIGRTTSLSLSYPKERFCIPFRGIKISVQLSRTFLNNTCFAYYTKSYENSKPTNNLHILTFYSAYFLLIPLLFASAPEDV